MNLGGCNLISRVSSLKEEREPGNEVEWLNHAVMLESLRKVFRVNTYRN